MSNRKNERKWSKSGFAIMLAEELVRAALREIYDGETIRIFQRDICAEPEADCVIYDRRPKWYDGHPVLGLQAMEMFDRRGQHPVITAMEAKLGDGAITKERFVSFNLIVGPVPEVQSRDPFVKVEATCRLFSVERDRPFWRPHFLNVTIGETINHFPYEAGYIGMTGHYSDDTPRTKPFAAMILLQERLGHPKSETEQDIEDRVLRVEAMNDRTHHVRVHQSNLGPYGRENWKCCINCGKPASEWTSESEECKATS